MTQQRSDHVGQAIRWSALSLGWALLVGATSLAAGVAAGSVALVGFGADSIVDGSVSAMLVWRFRVERSGARDTELVERRATRIVGAILVLIGLYLIASAVTELASHSVPDRSTIGIFLSAASALVLPVLATAKLRLAGPLDSSALRADGILSLAGAALASATLASLLLDASLGWWWSDAVAALAIAATLLREGVRAARA
jgi:divalent metal cation (Fe/Co/Zn/Cd) transporter